jgi:hypothetical protein
MAEKRKSQFIRPASVFSFALAVLFIAASALSAAAQASNIPVYKGFRGVVIGMAMDEAREKLGSPKDRSDEQDYFTFKDDESAQVYYDSDKKVSAITVTFTGKLSVAPSAKSVFGEDVAAKPDGGVFKMVRYPKAGYWISYNKLVGDDPMIMIAIKKL